MLERQEKQIKRHEGSVCGCAREEVHRLDRAPAHAVTAMCMEKCVWPLLLAV
jgi:hypothetical protein